MGTDMATETMPPDSSDSRRMRRSCLAPMTMLGGAVVMALVGSASLHHDSHSTASNGYLAARIAVPETLAEQTAAPSVTELTPADSRATALDETPQDAADGPPAHWAWIQMAPISPLLFADLLPETGAAEPPRTAITVPLPIPRPPEFRSPGGFAHRTPRRMARRDDVPVQPAAPPADERSFLEKLFGIERAPGLAYAALESKPFDVAPQRRISPPLALSREPSPTGGVAVYNIAARTVTLPSGERLEAHSGLAEGLDEPRLVNVRMRGPTPPGTYDLTEREQLFHGVRAIRLTPVGGSEAVYGRVGLLAHTFMLGPRGDSNGCVSFRDYEKFLQACLRGEVQRLVVVTGTQDPLPSVADGGRTRLARNGG